MNSRVLHGRIRPPNRSDATNTIYLDGYNLANFFGAENLGTKSH